jgi:uncharacterized protein (TIGR02391 family)
MLSNQNLIDAARALSAVVRLFGLTAKPESQQAQGTIDILDLYYNLVKDEELRKHTQKRFINGHYQDAVLEAFKYLNNYVKSRVRPTTADGSDLMQYAFSAKNPILRLNSFVTESEKNEQRGYMDIFAGTMIGIRNPRAHENDFDNDPFIAVRLLSLADHLLQRAQQAKRAKRKRRP